VCYFYHSFSYCYIVFIVHYRLVTWHNNFLRDKYSSILFYNNTSNNSNSDNNNNSSNNSNSDNNNKTTIVVIIIVIIRRRKTTTIVVIIIVIISIMKTTTTIVIIIIVRMYFVYIFQYSQGTLQQTQYKLLEILFSYFFPTSCAILSIRAGRYIEYTRCIADCST